MKIARALERADDGQADCYWHDNSMSMRYLIVLQGVTVNAPTGTVADVLAQRPGRTTSESKEYDYVSVSDPSLLPGEFGPLTVLLIL